jgi:hypothetical protein
MPPLEDPQCDPLNHESLVDHHREHIGFEFGLQTHTGTVDRESGALAELQLTEDSAILEQVIGLYLSPHRDPKANPEKSPKVDYIVKIDGHSEASMRMQASGNVELPLKPLSPDSSMYAKCIARV